MKVLFARRLHGELLCEEMDILKIYRDTKRRYEKVSGQNRICIR